MTKEGRKIGARIYRDASEADRKKKNVSCYKAYYEELKDELDPKDAETKEEPQKGSEQLTKGMKDKLKRGKR